MENKKMVVDTNLGIVDFLQVVNDIALEYFDVDGVYQPHIGMLNAMRVFYNICVKESQFDDEYGHDIFDAFDMENIMKDEDFILEFNRAINPSYVKLDFANAYIRALEIVENKKTSLGAAIDAIRNLIFRLMDYADGIFKDENLDKIADIAEKISAGKINAGTLVEAYTQSQRFKDVVNSEN